MFKKFKPILPSWIHKSLKALPILLFVSYLKFSNFLIALFLSLLAERKITSVKALRDSYPSYFMSKNKIQLTPDIDVDAILATMADKYKSESVNQIDGVKVDFENSWVHLRKSNTEPIITIESIHLQYDLWILSIAHL